jgi:hypothetical protein
MSYSRQALGTLLAQSEWLQRFRLRSNSNYSSILAAVALLGAVVLVAWLLARWFQALEQRREHCPRALFRELARAHGLNSAERNLLLRLAAQQTSNNPAAIFVEPQHFDVSRLGAAFDGEAARVQALREKLFGSLAR